MTKKERDRKRFNDWRKENKEHRNAYTRQWRKKNIKKDKLSKNAWREKNPSYATEWSRKNQDKVRGYRFKSEFGITLADYDRMFAEQDGKCAICESLERLKRYL